MFWASQDYTWKGILGNRVVSLTTQSSSPKVCVLIPDLRRQGIWAERKVEKTLGLTGDLVTAADLPDLGDGDLPLQPACQ